MNTALNHALTAAAALLVITSVACSHKATHDSATPAPTSTPIAATPVPAEAKDAAASKAASTGGATGGTTSVSCSHGSDTRVLAVESKGSGCNTNYTKNGKTASVATGTNGVDHCQKTIDKIRSKLEAGGYTCK